LKLTQESVSSPPPDEPLGGEIGITGVPYIHCPACRLTVYGGIAYREEKQCPRCGTDMSERPGSLFRAQRLDGGLPRTGAQHPPRRPEAPPPRGLSAAA
jgi:hypothetical protein